MVRHGRLSESRQMRKGQRPRHTFLHARRAIASLDEEYRRVEGEKCQSVEGYFDGIELTGNRFKPCVTAAASPRACNPEMYKGPTTEPPNSCEPRRKFAYRGKGPRASAPPTRRGRPRGPHNVGEGIQRNPPIES